MSLVSEIAGTRSAETVASDMTAVVESADDAIITETLAGVIVSWNPGAQQLLGYDATMIGKSGSILVPESGRDEELSVMARVRAGEHVPHYETTRLRNDGSLVEVSLRVSAIRDKNGWIVGVSKIARDITEGRRVREQQNLLLSEMNHRIKNLFALFSSVVSLTARSATTPDELAFALRERLGALAAAHTLMLPKPSDDTGRTEQPPTLLTLIEAIISPFDGRTEGNEPRIAIAGPDIPLSGCLVNSFALLIHEFASNAAKYGALSTPAGHVLIQCSEEDDQFILTWKERGGPRIEHPPDSEGFGSLLARMTAENQLQGKISHEWAPSGLTIRLSAARHRFFT